MIDPKNVPSVAADEKLARYILFSGHFRRSDESVKPDALIPHPRSALSVTRHLHTSEFELWSIGEDVAAARGRLYGRADFGVEACTKQRLRVEPDPIIPKNPNHANVTGWPPDKPAQKIIAQEIAATASYVARH